MILVEAGIVALLYGEGFHLASMIVGVFLATITLSAIIINFLVSKLFDAGAEVVARAFWR
jgi:hypothetical protein